MEDEPGRREEWAFHPSTEQDLLFTPMHTVYTSTSTQGGVLTPPT